MGENSNGLLVMLSSAQKNRAERLFHWKQDGVKALSEHETRNRQLACSRPSYAPNGWPAKQVASKRRPRKRNQTKKASAFRDDIKIEFGGRQSQNRSRSRARSHVDM